VVIHVFLSPAPYRPVDPSVGYSGAVATAEERKSIGGKTGGRGNKKTESTRATGSTCNARTRL
jgi:hypothetical protein